MLLIHPPQAKPSEPPAGIALLAATLRAHKLACTVWDMNIEGLRYLLGSAKGAGDTWSKRALDNFPRHLQSLRSTALYARPDAYGRAVADLNRVVEIAGKTHGLHLGLANYQDPCVSAQKSEDLLRCAETFEDNIYFPLFTRRLTDLLEEHSPRFVGFSLNYLSQAPSTFAMLGFLRRRFPHLALILGGGLVTTWLQNPGWRNPFAGLVDHLIAGPGEGPLLNLLGRAFDARARPDYAELPAADYLSPGFILPYSTSTGCFWRKCAFCPETSEHNAYVPVAPATVSRELTALTTETRPALLHLLDNAVGPAVLKTLADSPPGAPWYGFVRFSHHLADHEFCRRLRASGCVMLKLGLESGSQRILDETRKGIDLELVARVFAALRAAGIATYVYLLFGTPGESVQEARQTLDFVRKHHLEIGFLNLAIFNLPVCSPQVTELEVSDLHQGDLCLYYDFRHPRGWSRKKIRRFLDGEFKRCPEIRPILLRDPPIFTSNHAPFFTSVHPEMAGLP